MELVDEHGDLCAWCSDNPEDFIRIPPAEAIRLMTLKYTEYYSVSPRMRTLYYRAAEAWQYQLSQSSIHPLAIPATELPLCQFMALVCEEYKPELYDAIDLVDIDDDELLALCEEKETALEDSDEPTSEALDIVRFNCLLMKWYKHQDCACSMTVKIK